MRSASSSDDILALVFVRNAFFRRLHFLALAAFALSLLVILILLWMLYYVRQHPTEPVYFATDEVSKLINVIPVSQPNMSYNEVVKWTNNALQTAFSFDYINYRRQLQSSQKYFNEFGWKNYLDSLTASNNLDAVRIRKFIVLAQVVTQPKLINQGLLGGAYAWKFEYQLLVTTMRFPYDNKHNFINPWIVSVIVRRQPILQSDHGLGIVQFLANLAIPSNTTSTQTGK